MPDRQVWQVGWTGWDASKQRYLVVREGVTDWPDWTVTLYDDQGSRTLKPIQSAVKIGGSIFDAGSGCWLLGHTRPAALDIAMRDGQAIRLLGPGSPGRPPKPGVAGVDVRVPKVGFESDWDGDWFMFPGPSELDARDWIVEVTSNTGQVRVSEWEERFSGYRELAPGQGCWGVVEARFGEIHVRFPERPDQRVCVHKWEGDLRSTSPWSMPPWTPP